MRKKRFFILLLLTLLIPIGIGACSRNKLENTPTTQPPNFAGMSTRGSFVPGVNTTEPTTKQTVTLPPLTTLPFGPTTVSPETDMDGSTVLRATTTRRRKTTTTARVYSDSGDNELPNASTKTTTTTTTTTAKTTNWFESVFG